MLAWIRSHAGELGRFGVVGIAGVFVNLGVFNLLRLGPLSEDSTFLGEQDRVITAKVIATLVSIVFAWAAHRSWTFKGKRTHRPLRELIIFGLVNLVAIVAEVGTVAISHYVLDFTSLAADNIASIIGIGIGTVLRYLGYKLFVFAEQPPAALLSGAGVSDADDAL
ncbi:GtrA family protein [Demequina sp.]|uniref:GtrA family protein n=1 Tax=Demequina sp. TaxID=2050685 RepID=UPI003D0D99E4